MFFDKRFYYWFSQDIKEDEICRVKDVFHLSREVSDDPDRENILSLTQKGIVIRDISKNEGQLPKSFEQYNKIKKGDIVLNPMDLLTGWVDISSHEGLISPSYKNLRIKDPSESLKFYCFQFQRYYKEKIFFNNGEGVSYDYRWGISDDILMNFPIVRKPIKIQCDIVKKIETSYSEISSKIEISQKKIELLRELKSSVLKDFY